MPLYELGMTQEDIIEASKPAPEADYLLTFEGFILYHEGKDDEDIYHPTKAGGRMVKGKFRIESENPKASGKRIVYNGVVGSFSFENMSLALPFMKGTGIDSDAANGRQVRAHVIEKSYTNPETDETTLSNEIKGKMRPA